MNLSIEGALSYIFEDSEAVIKMIMKGRSRTLRHVSRTHRVALDWLFGRINLDPKIQIKYIDTKNQLADILTKGNFTRDEWNHLLCLFNISLFSSQSCSEVSSQDCSEAMAKKPQEGDYDERVVAKSKPVENMVSRSRAGTSTMPSSRVSSSPRKFGYKDHEMRFEANTEQPVVENSQQDLMKGDTMTNSQVRHLDARSKATTGSPMARKSNRISNSQASTGHTVIKKSKQVRATHSKKNLVTDINLEAKEECNNLSAK